ncbi:MAG: hypothetical protein BLITH_0175 [Brockia lithotrophica]|uniref:Uncharacterized protein n=1 Tax=Brockia lithotrophica TaxID=933949 RepID=A0A2T5GA92_9BACL|nr:MAG: hypothetical protein BLITH_0175 [Brockia lithotrophica]
MGGRFRIGASKAARRIPCKSAIATILTLLALLVKIRFVRAAKNA